MDPLQWAIDPWGKTVPIHIAWFLIWVAVVARKYIHYRPFDLLAVFRET